MHNIFLIFNHDAIKHLTGWGHPESPARYIAINNALMERGMKREDNSLVAREATLEELKLCHASEYVELVRQEALFCEKLGVKDGSYTLSTGDVQICPDSWRAGLLAAGGALMGVEAIMEGKAKTAFSYLRPPGHHACTAQGMGFCLFNNAALAARYAQRKYGIKRVLIADWDVHHGNGTQEIFESDPSVFYFSTHQAGIYPGTGLASDRGTGQGLGTKLNFPIKGGEKSRDEVLQAFRVELVEAMVSFQPEFIIISAGFDAHVADPLGGFNLTKHDFADLTEIVKGIADKWSKGRILSVLEGGYNLQALEFSSVAHVKTLMS
jgi:acetoin utilization deacetylase AcuC-like enzyme